MLCALYTGVKNVHYIHLHKVDRIKNMKGPCYCQFAVYLATVGTWRCNIL